MAPNTNDRAAYEAQYLVWYRLEQWLEQDDRAADAEDRASLRTLRNAAHAEALEEDAARSSTRRVRPRRRAR